MLRVVGNLTAKAVDHDGRLEESTFGLGPVHVSNARAKVSAVPFFRVGTRPPQVHATRGTIHCVEQVVLPHQIRILPPSLGRSREFLEYLFASRGRGESECH